MRVFALSDIHVDYDANARWVDQLSTADYRDDVLILAGDVTHRPPLFAQCLSAFAARFAHVLFVPGNHDLWVLGDDEAKTSLDKFREVTALAQECGASLEPLDVDGFHIAPLFGWYDYSFGEPGEELQRVWADFRACRWPEGFTTADIAAHFTALNQRTVPHGARTVITYSHFLPRIDLIPAFVPARHRMLDPVLGSSSLDRQLRDLRADIHVYGHSHIARSTTIDGVRYVNNAFGYPQEGALGPKQLACIAET